MLESIKRKKEVFLFGVIGITIFCMLTTFEYCDFNVMTIWSVNIWDLVFEGRLMDFYKYNELNYRGTIEANCSGNFLWLLPWAVWNFPIWIYHKITGVMKITDFFSLCWSKTYLVILTFVTAHYITKIAKKVTDGQCDGKLMWLIILASPELLMSTCYAGQDEIFYITLFCIALYCYITGNHRKFYVLSVLAVTCCPIMLIPFLALLFLKEKNIIKILFMTIGTMVPLLIFELLFRSDVIYMQNKTDFAHMIEAMLGMSSPLMGGASIFGVALILVYFYCYSISLSDGKEDTKKVLFINMIVFVLMSVYMDNNFYRLFLYVPFLALAVGMNPENKGINMFLVLFLTYSRTLLACSVNVTQNMNTFYVMKNSWISWLCERYGNGSYGYHCDFYGILMNMTSYGPTISMLAQVCAFGAMLLLILINNPRNTKTYHITFSWKVSTVLYVCCMPIFMLMFYKVLM